MRRRLGKSFDICFSISPGGQVELVCSLRQLGYPWNGERVRRAYVHDNFQGLEIFIDVSELAFQLVSFGFGLIQILPLFIFLSQMQYFKSVQLHEGARELGEVLRHLHGHHFREFALYKESFRRVVIHINKAVQPQVQLPGNFPHVLRFVLPVCADAGEIFDLELHIGMFFESFADQVQVVLAVDGKQAASILQGFY